MGRPTTAPERDRSIGLRTVTERDGCARSGHRRFRFSAQQTLPCGNLPASPTAAARGEFWFGELRRGALPSSPIVGAFVFPDFWENSFRANSNLARLRDCGVNAIMTESDSYELSALDATHKAGLRFLAGVACFSDHASNFHSLNKRPELWPVLENGERRPQMEWMLACRRWTAGARKRRLRKSSRLRGCTPWTGFFSILRAGRCTGKSSLGLGEGGRSI